MVQDFVLSERGRWTETVVVDIDEERDRGGGTTYDCLLARAGDGSRLPHRLSGGACGDGTGVGDRVRVIEDPEGFAGPSSGTPRPGGAPATAGALTAFLAATAAVAVVRRARRDA